jgi:hypothetical protein
VPLAETHHVVVDGSNLATEGRTFPSLKQLDEAVRAYASEDPDASIIVVVDATFEHRVDDAEREEVRQAMLNGEIISPPAGAIGRGDAFVLRIAERTSATVLSNDSFQEFHGEHPWLFEDGRLIGGKPVPGVGWIFTPRLPIRGPKSRAATAEARAKKDPESAPAKAAELAKAAKKAAKRTSKARKSAPAQTAPVDTSWPITPTAPPPGRANVNPVFSSAIDEAVEEALHPPKPEKSRGASKKETVPIKAAPEKRGKGRGDAPSGRGGDRRRSRAKADASAGPDGGRHQQQRPTPPPAVNEPLTFINFVAAFPVGSTIQGEVVSFTSHGAMVDVPLPAGGAALHCYIPLTAMGTPPPTKARQVLKKGEVRSFVLAGLDPPRRVAELAIPSGATEPVQAKTDVPAVEGSSTTRAASSTKKAASKKSAASKKAAAPAKKAAKKAAKMAEAPAKKSPAKKSEASAKKAPAKKATAKKSTAKQASANKAAKAKKVPGKKAPAKKAGKARAE